MEFRILGPLEVVDESGPVALGTNKERVVLAVLLLHANEFVSRERLIDELWGESPPATAKKAVNVYISQLRKAVARNGADPITTAAGGYRLSVDPDRVDAACLQQLVAEARESASTGKVEAAADLYRQALRLWRGRTLAGLELESSGRLEIEQLEELRLAVLMDRIDCDLALGRHEQLIGELHRLVSEHPLRERLRGQQMLALYRAERQAEALDVYQRARQALVDELGIEPSPALQRLQHGILAHDPALEIPTGTGAAESEPRAARPAATRRPWRIRPRRRYLVAGGALAVALAGGLTALATQTGAHARPHVALPVLANSILQLAPSTGKVVGETTLGVEPASVALTPSSLWVVSRGDRTVQTGPYWRLTAQGNGLGPPLGLGLPHPYDIATDPDGNVWVSERKPTVTWVERLPSGSGTAAVTPKTLDVNLPGPAAGAVATGAGYLWVIPGPLSSGAGSDRVSLVDLSTHRFVSSIRLGRQTTAIAFGFGSAWIGTYDARDGSSWLSVIRPGSARPQSIRVETGDGYGPLAIAAGDGSVWAITSAGTLVRIDPVTRKVLKRFQLAADAPELLAVGAGAVWIVNDNDWSVSKLDPNTGRIRRIPLGAYTMHLCAIAATQNAVFVTVGDSFCDTTNR